MEYRSFDINVTSVKGVKARNSLFFKSRVYAVVSVVTTTSISSQKTPLGNSLGGKNNKHTWDFPMRFYLDESKLQKNHVIIMIQLRRRRALCSDKDLGVVYVPLKGLFDDNNTQNDSVHWVVNTSGKPNGYLSLSFKFSDMIRGAVRRDGNDYDDDVLRLMQLRSAARRAVSTPSAPYIGTNPVCQLLLFES